jgi:hypothetical protein
MADDAVLFYLADDPMDWVRTRTALSNGSP